MAIKNHVENGLDCGHFARSILENDLLNTITYADTECLPLIRDIVIYCYNNIPQECWGSHEKVQSWKNKGGNKTKTNSSSP